MTLHDGRARLTQAAQQLRIKWRDAQSQWDDAASRDFEQEHLEPLAPKLSSTLQAIERMAEILQKAQKECQCT